MSFLLVNLHPGACHLFLKVYSRQLAIIGEPGDVKIYTVAGLVRISLLNKPFHKGNHLRDMICGLTDDLRFFNIQ